MKRTVMLMLALVLSAALALAGCSKKDETKAADGGSVKPGEKKISGEVTVWSGWDDNFFQQQFDLDGFKQAYPDVKLNLVKMDAAADAAKTAIAAGQGGPDVVIMSVGDLKKYNTIAGLEDLLQQPYDFGQYKKDYPDSAWNLHLSLDGKKLIAVPWDLPPSVAYYRADLMEQNGFPSDPAEFGAYIQDPEQFFDMAQKLKANGITTLGSDRELVDLMTAGIGFFDKDLNYIRNTPEIANGIDLAKRSKQLGIGDKNINVWIPEGKDKLNTGKWALIARMGAWFTDACCFPNLAPDTKGKWKATNMPLGAYGRDGGTTMSILSMSKNKEAAWAFVKHNSLSQSWGKKYAKAAHITANRTFWTLPEYEAFKDPFLGDQAVAKLYTSLGDKVPSYISTELDDKANTIWDPAINDAIEKGTDSTAVLTKLKEDIEKLIKNDRDNILRVRGA